MAKIDVAVDGPFASPSAEEVAVTRAEGHRHGLAARPGPHRAQEAAVNGRRKVPHKLGRGPIAAYKTTAETAPYAKKR